MADNVWSSPVLVAVASGTSLVLKELVDRIKINYRKSHNGDRRNKNDNDTHLDLLRDLIINNGKSLEDALERHAAEDSRRFDELMARFESDSKLMHERYHQDASKIARLVAEVSLLMQGKIRQRGNGS